MLNELFYMIGYTMIMGLYNMIVVDYIFEEFKKTIKFSKDFFMMFTFFSFM